MNTLLSPELLESLRQLDSCTVANAIETFKVRLRNEGFSDGRTQCLFPGRPAVIGHAVTARIHTSNPPVKGRSYADRTDWWNYILTIPAPRIVVIQDSDEKPAFGSMIGEVHASILEALGVVALLTNGAVRDLPALEKHNLQVFAARPSVSHAYAHLVEFGQPVQVAGLSIQPGDLLHGDAHGIVSIPESTAAKIPQAAAAIREEKRRILELCRSPEFSLTSLGNAVRGIFPDDPFLPDQPKI